MREPGVGRGGQLHTHHSFWQRRELGNLRNRKVSKLICSCGSLSNDAEQVVRNVPMHLTYPLLELRPQRG